MTPAWIVCAWPPVMWQACSTPDLHFVHLGTSVLSDGDLRHPLAGQTLWGNPSESLVAAVAWDWVQLAQGVFVMADPLGLVTNLLNPKIAVLYILISDSLCERLIKRLCGLRPLFWIFGERC